MQVFSYQFEEFELDLRRYELRRNGQILKLERMPMELLILMVSREGALISREEIIDKLWGRDVFVETEHGINTAVRKIRQTLRDDPENPRFIKTLKGRGYRFDAKIIRSEKTAGSDSAENESISTVSLDRNESDPTSSHLIPQEVTHYTALGVIGADGRRMRFGMFTAKSRWISVGATLLTLLCTIGIWRFARYRWDVPLPPIEVMPLVGLSGLEVDPAFSPDGKQVAFAVHDTQNPGIYATVVGGEKALRLTSNSRDGHPRWSPDGRQVAFLRPSDEGIAIYLIPAFGGTERRLYFGPAASGWVKALDWSPDGKVLAFTESDAKKTHSWIAFISLADSTTRRLTSPSDEEIDYGVAFSPDGSTVAFVRGIVSGGVSDLYVVSSAGGTAKRLTFDNTGIAGSPAWTQDGHDIVFCSTRGGLPSLWHISVSGGTPQPVVGVGESAYAPSISSKGNQLVYQHFLLSDAIWQINLKDEMHRLSQPAQLISEKGRKRRPQFSPDGKRIAFESDRLGYQEIWTCDSDGSNCEQLTSLRGVAGAVTWSPDGRSIAFEFLLKDHREIYLQDVDSGMPRLLATLPGADNGGPNWSRDGKWIYFNSDRGGSFQLWKVQLRGGSPIQVTRHGGVFAIESTDGRDLYYAKFDSAGIWKMPVQGGEEKRVLDQPSGGTAWRNWVLAQNGIYFLNFETNPNATVSFFDFATHKIIPLWTLTKPPGKGLSVSIDGRSILYVQNEFVQSNLMLVKNFH